MSNIQPNFRYMGRQKGRIHRSGFAAAWKRNFAVMILLLVVCSGTERSKAQTTPINNYSTTNFFDTVVDAYGNRYALGQLSTDDRIRSAYNAIAYSPMVVSSCETGYFQCYFDNGSGFEDDTNPIHLQRRAVLCQVLHDLSQMIKSPCLTTGQKVNLWVQNAGTGSGILGTGTPFFNFPFLTSTSGILDNTAWITINSGRDAFIDAAAPISTSGGGSVAGTYFHGAIKFNFDGSVNWNYNLAGTPGADTADLYTVCLHEISHILGFMSMIDFTGDSYIGLGFKYYTRYDQFLKTPGGDSLITNGTPGCNMYNWRFNPSLTPATVLAPGTSGSCAGSVPDHTNCSNAIKYTGSVTQPVYTPSCFKFGSSLSHFEDECWVPAGFPLGSAGAATNNQYFVLSNAAPSGAYSATTNPGVMKRYLTPEERKVFCDIGYTMDTVFGNTYNHNYKTYSGGICNGIQVAGINDGIIDGAYSFMVSGGTPSVNINPASNPFLRNDHGADRFKCLEIISGTGTLSAMSGDSTTPVNYGYVSGASGVQLLRYIPYNSVTGQEGNITYIYVYVASSFCVPDACNLVPNRGFESLVPSSYTPTLIQGATCWSAFNGSPDLFNRYDLSTARNIPNSYLFGAPGQAEVHSFSAAPNDHYAGFVGGPTAIPDLYNMESTSALLTSPMHTGMTYQVSFWAKMATYGYDTIPAKIQFATSPTIVAPAGTYLSALPAGMTELCNFTITHPDDNWHYYTQNITYTGTAPAIMLAILDAPYLMPVGYYAYHHSNYIGLDDISITPLTASSSFVLPDTLCSATGVIDLDTTVGIPGGTFTWYADTAGIIYTSHSNLFDASSAYAASLDSGGSGLVTICYNYTDGLGCGGQLCHSVQIIPHSYSATASPSTICAGDSSTLTTSGPVSAVYTWSPSVSCTGAGCNVAKVSPAATTTYTVNSVSMCPATVTVTVIPTSPITGGDYICLGGTLTLHDAVSGGTWSGGTAGVATVSSSGIVSGITAGTATITYTLPSGCNVTKIITVLPPPPAITGSLGVCTGNYTSLSDSITGGTWSITGTTVASVVAATGVVHGAYAGTATITYTTPIGCTTTAIITVNPIPPAITGTLSICIGAITTLSDSMPGGTWFSDHPTIAPIASSGIATGLSAGLAGIAYVVNGCAVWATLTVNFYPEVDLIEPETPVSVCAGTIVPLSDVTILGAWSSSAPSVATVSATGIVTTLSGGTAIISYTKTTFCGSISATKTITVNPIPATPVITASGATTFCSGSSIVLSATGTGVSYQWYNGSTAIAGATGATCMVTDSGTYFVKEITPFGCSSTSAATTVVVNPAPVITSGSGFCMFSTPYLTAVPTGGTWSSADPSIAYVYPVTGELEGLSADSVLVTYTLATGCSASMMMYGLNPADGDSCSPCVQFAGKPFNEIGYGGTISADIPAGNYHINGDVNIAGDVSFNDAVIFVAPGAHIYVKSVSSLTLNGCHLFTCTTNMWGGIVLQSDGVQTGRITLQGGTANFTTLIEDARYAIYVDSPIVPSGGSPYFIASYNAVFNRDNCGIYIGDYNPSGDVYPFLIQNTVFTSRSFSGYSYSSKSYPFAWPATTGIAGALKNNITPTSPYKAPYYLTRYPAANCNNLSYAYAGIQLSNIGTGTEPNYARVQIGSPSTAAPYLGVPDSNLNVFDSLGFGVYATNANVTVQNSVFANMRSIIDKSPKPSADYGCAGIYTNMTDGNKYQLEVVPGSYDYYQGGVLHNLQSPDSIYNCMYGVYSNDYFRVKGYKAVIKSSMNAIGNNRYGYYLQSSSYEDVSVSGNRIYNVANGIVFNSTFGASYWVPTLGGGAGGYFAPGSQYAGNITVDSNHIQAALGSAIPDTEYVSFGIALQNVVSSTTSFLPGPMYATGTVHTDHNTITQAYRGILIQSYWDQSAYTLNNYISVRTAPQGSMSYGISHTDCAKSHTMANAVVGAPGSTTLNDSTRGYYFSSNTGAELGCNQANDIGRGYEFYLKNPGTAWHDNLMNGNLKGMVLNAAQLGDQGTNDFPADNVWNPLTPWNATYLQTYVIGDVSAVYSKMFVKDNVSNKPTYNSSEFAIDRYDASLGSVIPSVSTNTYDCIVTGGTGGGTGAGARHGNMHEQYATKRVNYQVDSAGNDFLGQYLTWQSVLNDSTLTDTSAILQSFKTLAVNSRYEYLNQIEHCLATGNTSDASTKLSSEPLTATETGAYFDSTTGVIVADDHNSDYIVDNYKAFYILYLNYLNKNMTSDDSTQVVVLAGMCPYRYGAAVYRARCLYTVVFNDLRIWNDDSCTKADTGSHVAARSSKPPVTTNITPYSLQQYQLFPNPNNGNITISQLIADDKPVYIDVMEVTGRSVYKNSVQFESGVYKVQLDRLVPGVYMMQLMDNSGKRYNFKFVKE